MQRALELFQQAAQADPSYAPAYSGIADASALLASWQFASPDAMYPKAVAAARRAIELDPSSADAHASLGFIKLNWEWDWEGATSELHRAIELNPSHETAHRWLSAFLAGIGKDEEAVPIAQRAIDLDPISVLPDMNLGIVHFLAGRQEEAAAQFGRVIEKDPGFVRGYGFLAVSLSLLGRDEEAITSARRGTELANQHPMSLLPLGWCIAQGGDHEQAHMIIDPIVRDGLDPIYEAMSHAAFDDDAAALTALERGYDERSDWMYAVATQPWFRRYHGNPRFVGLLERMKLLPALNQDRLSSER